MVTKIGAHNLLLILILLISAAVTTSPQAEDPIGMQAFVSTLLTGEYVGALERYVDDEGLVDYVGLKADRQGLDAFVEAIAALESGLLERVNDREQIAMLINVYNALTLKVVVDHYPISKDQGTGQAYPANSIRQIPGVWDDVKFTFMSEEVSLNQIEHDILRTRFEEPRIHMALVCASIGCPSLRRELYVGVDLDAQLDDQTRRFLGLARNFRIDRDAGIVYLSSIFDWFAGDFAGFDEGGTVGGAVAFVSRYVAEADREYLLEASYEIAYLPYDWALNDQASGGGR